ncbi:hypothetical protein [Eubacterium maltosivorans]|uniref:Uncharacterized protein n=1 Tax=Eubacterium maltosivorans TaxID=2041044 RepID=A0A4P9C3D5_EUBML|nr:hypothetical protein [Eubacterium maltosivorans]QCT69760.1 hypothetical protein CPZ25_000025 [Eubacterium maltosivorans]
MESINTHKIKYKFIAILMALVIAITPFSSIHRVKANTIEDTLKFGIPVVALILAALTSNGAISGGYKVSPADLSSITEKAQANLQAAGSAAIDQANKLGEAIKSGAESAKIKALASGAVIYAFLQAIQETLWNFETPNPSALPGFDNYDYLANTANFTWYFNDANVNTLDYFFPITYPTSWEQTTYNRHNALGTAGLAKPDKYKNGSITGYVRAVTSSGQVYSYDCYNMGTYFIIVYDTSENLSVLGELVMGTSHVLNPSVNQIAKSDSLTIPTVLPQTIINNINTWDGTSDLVLAPPLPYDIPTGEDLVIDPSYTGSEVEDPDTPDIPDKPEDIDMPWLSALLALLGLGNPSLDGIEAGVKTAIDTIIDGITATAQDVFDGSKEIFGNITDALTGIDATVQSGIDALTGSISVPLTNIADFALSVPDFFAIPEGKSIATPIIEQIPQVFPIVDQMNTALNKITVETRPLIIYYPYLDGSTKQITLDWYEPAREQVKHGVGLLFKVVTALACFAMVSNVFGIGIRVGTGQAYTDNNSGGGSGNSRKKED